MYIITIIWIIWLLWLYPNLCAVVKKHSCMYTVFNCSYIHSFPWRANDMMIVTSYKELISLQLFSKHYTKLRMVTNAWMAYFAGGGVLCCVGRGVSPCSTWQHFWGWASDDVGVLENRGSFTKKLWEHVENYGKFMGKYGKLMEQSWKMMKMMGKSWKLMGKL